MKLWGHVKTEAGGVEDESFSSKLNINPVHRLMNWKWQGSEPGNVLTVRPCSTVPLTCRTNRISDLSFSFILRFPAGAGNFSLHHRIQNGSGAHPASYPMGTRGSFPAGKAAGPWSWQPTSI